MKTSLKFLLVSATLASPSAANEVIVLRSGQVNGAPGNYPDLDDQTTCIFTSQCNSPLSTGRFDIPDFDAARAGAHAEICIPLSVWPSSLTADPEARWINWGDMPGHLTTGAGSALYAISFQVTTPGATTCSLDLSWAVDDRLGDDVGWNPVGVYVNETSLDESFGGGSDEHSQVGVPVHPGTNTLYLYQRDTGCSDAGLMFSCTIDVDPPCEDEVHVLRSGQHDGQPGTGGQLDDLARGMSLPVCNTPLSTAVFGASDFATADTGPAAIICTPIFPWPQNLPDDPLARWINWGSTPQHDTTGAGSELYALPFVISSPLASTASVEISWAVDDVIGDPSGPNSIGAYMNGTPLDSGFTLGSTHHVQSAVAVHPGANTLYIYQRDTGCSDAGLMFSATIRVPVACGSASYCLGDGTGTACPCANSGAMNHGCENSSTTGGAYLVFSGTPSLGNDTAQLSCTGEKPTAFSVVLQGTTQIPAVHYGDGLRCIGGSLKRLYKRNAVGGAIHVPDTGDLSISAQSAARSNVIVAGSSRYYQIAYRDPSTTFCPSPSGNTFNVSNAIRIDWGW